MNTQHPYYLIAAEAYGTGTYDCGAYQEGCPATGTGASTGTGNGGLSYTGYNVLIPLAIAGALIIAATILLVTRFMRRRKSLPQA